MLWTDEDEKRWVNQSPDNYLAELKANWAKTQIAKELAGESCQEQPTN